MHVQRTDTYQTHASSTHVKRPSVLLTKHDCRLAKMVIPIHPRYATGLAIHLKVKCCFDLHQNVNSSHD